MRQFRLINAKGATYDLNRGISFLSEPSGLGFDYNVKYENYNDFFVEKNREIKQPKVKGTINFKSYQEYHNFIMFCQFKPLELEYTAYKTYFMTCNVDKIIKKEIGEGGFLPCDIEIVGVTSFYQKIVMTNTSVSNVGKIYNYSYPYTYSNGDTGTVEFDVESNMESGIKLTMMGPLINPSWSYFVNGNKVLSGKINANIAAGNRLVIDTTKSPYRIHEINARNELIEDRYPNSDFSTKRFILLQPGTNVITCTHEGTNLISMTMEAHVNYESV